MQQPCCPPPASVHGPHFAPARNRRSGRRSLRARHNPTAARIFVVCRGEDRSSSIGDRGDPRTLCAQRQLERSVGMKRSVIFGLLVAGCMLILHAPPALAKRASMVAGLLNALYVGDVTVDELVAATAASCKCAPPRRGAAAAGVVLPSVEVGSATGAPGQQVQFSVVLHTAGQSVAGVQDDIAFDSINTPVAASGAGRPDCTVNPDINKEATGFSFQPPGCTGTGCTAFRALVLSFSNVDPIADGSVMYTCKVNISPGAAGGT